MTIETTLRAGQAAPDTGPTPAAADALRLLRAGMPIAAAGLLHMAITLTDSLLLAALGPDQLAGAAIVSDARGLVYYFVGGGFAALAPLVASVRDDSQAVRGLFVSGRRLAVLLVAAGFVPVATLGWTLPRIGVHLPDPASASGFALAIAVACAAMIVSQFLRGVLVPLGRGRAVVVAMSAAVPVNAAASLVLIHGAGPVPALGAAGAGWGTAVAYAVVASWLSAVAARAVGVRVARAPAAPLRPLASATVMTGFGLLFETGLFMIATLAVGCLVPEATAEHVVAFRFLGVCYCVFVGLGQAISVDAACAARRGRTGAGLAATLVAALTAGLAAAVAAGAVIGPTLEAVVAVPTSDAASLSRHVAATLVALALAVAGLSTLRGRGEIRAAAVVAAGGYWGCGLTLLGALALSGPVTLEAVWTALLGGTAVTALLAWAMVLAPAGDRMAARR